MIRIIGLTGGIASGKSTVSGMLRVEGADVIDADAVYHGLITPVLGEATILTRKIAVDFGDVILPDGSLDRAALGAKVFGDPKALEKLGQITHPMVAQEAARQMQEIIAARPAAQKDLPIFYDVPLLYENGLEKGCEAVVVVWVPLEIQRQRLMLRNGLSAEEADVRLASQMSLDDKRQRANFVIDNSGEREKTRAQVQELWAKVSGSP